MSKEKIPNEKRAKELLIKLVHDIKDEISDDPKIMISMISILVGATISAGEIKGDELLSAIITHLVDNDLFQPEIVTEEQLLALHSVPSKYRLN